MGNIHKSIYTIMELTKEHETMPDWALAMKLSEECGEVNECVLVENGFMPHKMLKEDTMHEVADVFNVCVGLLVKRYPDQSVDTLMNNFCHALEKKTEKYRHIMGVKND